MKCVIHNKQRYSNGYKTLLTLTLALTLEKITYVNINRNNFYSGSRRLNTLYRNIHRLP